MAGARQLDSTLPKVRVVRKHNGGSNGKKSHGKEKDVGDGYYA